MELSEEQRTAVRWQWYLMGSMIGIILLSFLAVNFLPPDGLIPFIDQSGPGWEILYLTIFGLGGLYNLAIGILSVRYRVTIIGRRIKFWVPIEGGMAVFHGWMAIVGGVILILAGLFTIFEAGNTELILYYLGSLFALVMLGGIVYGLRRALADQD